MAKLTARGRTCVAEATRIYDAAELQAAHDRRYQDGQPALTTFERVTRRLMSDGKVLEKVDVVFQPSEHDWNGPQKHTYGWKVRGTLKAGLTPASWAEAYRQPRRSGAASQWTVTTTGLGRTVVISPARIRRAVASGESIGFCGACGAERDGVEPDARGYRCEACGESAVSGAEECLLSL